jgi:hypothetical protein
MELMEAIDQAWLSLSRIFFPLGCIFFLPTIASVVTATLPYIESLAGCRLRNGDGDTVTTTDGSAAAARDGLGLRFYHHA